MERIKSNESLGKTITSTRVRRALATLLSYPLLKIFWLSNKSDIIAVVDGLSRNKKFRIFSSTENLETIAQNEIYKDEEINITYPLKEETPKVTLERILLEQQKDEVGSII